MINKNVKAFIEHVRLECYNHGIRLILSKDRYVNTKDDGSGSLCSGYFEKKTSTLAVATGKPFKQWLPILVHEYGHMTQHVSNCRYWREKYLKACDDNFDWIEGKREFTEKDVKRNAMLNMMIEVDCERRTVGLIKKYKLPIDAAEYAQKANSYVLFYHLIVKRKSFYATGYEPYNVKKVWTKMPKHFNMDYRRPPKRLLAILDTLPSEVDV